MEAGKNSPVYKMAVDWKMALPLHPEYRTLPMVWYVPPLSPITARANARPGGRERRDSRRQAQLRIPVQYLANLLTAGDTGPVVARWNACWPCAYQRGQARRPATRTCPPSQQAGPDDGRGRGDVPRDGDRQLRGPFRDPRRTASTPRTPSTCAAAAASFGNGCSGRIATEVSMFGGKKPAPSRSRPRCEAGQENQPQENPNRWCLTLRALACRWATPMAAAQRAQMPACRRAAPSRRLDRAHV